MAIRNERPAILIFARTPVAGAVKTRLQPVLGEEGTLLLHKALIRHVVQQVSRSGLGRVELWISSDDSHGFFESLIDSGNIYLQQGADLGARMAHAAADALQRSDSVMLIGADCPAIDAAYLEQALGALERGHDIVFGPAEDGGYVLLGLRRVPGVIFGDVPWGSSAVMDRTRRLLECAGETWMELPPSWDVDRPEDLPRLFELIPELQKLLAASSRPATTC